MVEINLKSLTEFFKSKGLPCQSIKATDKIPFDYLFVCMNGEEDGQGSIVQIRISKQVFDTEGDKLGFPANSKGYYYLQFTMPLNVEIKETALWDLSRLILLVNRTNDLPGYEFSEIDKVVFYRYSLIIPGAEIDPYLLMTIVGNALMFNITFGDFVQDVASGTKTFHMVIDELKKIQGIIPQSS